MSEKVLHWKKQIPMFFVVKKCTMLKVMTLGLTTLS